MGWSIRRASTDDLDAMLDLWRMLEAAQAAHRMFPMREGAEAHMLGLFREAIADDGSAALVAQDDGGMLIGMAIAEMRKQGHANMSAATVVSLSRVVVSPEHRGEGIGSALIQEAERFGRERGATWLTAKLFTGNQAGRAFWEARGFVSRYEERVRPIE